MSSDVTFCLREDASLMMAYIDWLWWEKFYGKISKWLNFKFKIKKNNKILRTFGDYSCMMSIDIPYLYT